MPLTYNATKLGTLTLIQTDRDTKKEMKFKIQIRQGNCLAVFLNIYKQSEPKDPSKPWVHQLVMFFADEQHLKNCLKSHPDDGFDGIFWGKIKDIKLNTYYKESRTLLKYFTQTGKKVTAYYKEP